MLDKKAFRERVFADAVALDDAYLRDSDDRIFERLTALPEFASAQTVLAYHSVGREVSTRRFIAHALGLGKTVCLPDSRPGGVMFARVVASPDALSPGLLGIPSPSGDAVEVSPETLDFVVVPAPAFDREGYRIGRGGGYYDRFLPRTRGFTVGLARDALLAERVPREPHDYPVLCVVTETSVYRFC